MSDENIKNENTEEVGEDLQEQTQEPVAESAEAPPSNHVDPTESAAESTEAPSAPEVAEAVESEPATSTIEDLRAGMELQGTVKSIELYGAFVDVGVGKDALLHISQLGKSNIRNVEDIVKKGETITVYVLKVEPESGRIALSLEKPPEKPISDLRVGDVVAGKVVRLESFGAFVDIGAERPGMIHVSELATDYIQKPEDVVNVGDDVKAKVIKVNRKKRQIDLSIKALEEEEVREAAVETAAETEEEENMPTAMELALRRAMQDASDDEPGQSSDKQSKQRDSTRKKRELEDALSRTLKRHNN